MHPITLFGIQLSIQTLALVAAALVALAVAVGTSRRRARARRAAMLPPLVFEVHDRPEPQMRPMMYRPLVPTPPGPEPAWPYVDAGARDGRTVRVPRYEERRDYLPGRLEVQAGATPGEEIRFVRTASDTADITLGRDDGPLYSHVKLPVDTVSRRHARLQYDHGRWKISNLSSTNPTLVNGEELLASGGARWLDDGDTIEIGEMVFRFRAR